MPNTFVASGQTLGVEQLFRGSVLLHRLRFTLFRKLDMNMNCTNLGAIRARSLVLALGLACTLPVAAQSTTGSGSAGTTATTGATRTTDTVERRDDGFDWGWLGLLGLAGLAGLRRKPEVRHVDPVRMPNSR